MSTLEKELVTMAEQQKATIDTKEVTMSTDPLVRLCVCLVIVSVPAREIEREREFPGVVA